ncbi:MAG: alpha/beta fold hydrolase [Acidimicrobiales bacterium]
MDTNWPDPEQASTHLGTLEYRDIGDGPVLVLLHLILAAGDHWDQVVDRLADRYRCIMPDLPMGGHRVPARAGADLSAPGMARAVAELLDQLDVDDVTLIGNDTGGAIAQIVAADHNNRVGRLVLTDCDMYDQFPPGVFAYFKLIGAIPGGVWLLAHTLRLRAIWRLPIAFGWLTHRVDGAKVERWSSALRANPEVRRDARSVIKAIDTRHTNDAAAKLRTAGVPLLLAWGADDRAFSRANAERMATEVPGARLEIIEGSKAFVCWDQPDRLAELIDGFVAGP